MLKEVNLRACPAGPEAGALRERQPRHGVQDVFDL
jgi:hypothetical protein